MPDQRQLSPVLRNQRSKRIATLIMRAARGGHDRSRHRAALSPRTPTTSGPALKRSEHLLPASVGRSLRRCCGARRLLDAPPPLDGSRSTAIETAHGRQSLPMALDRKLCRACGRSCGQLEGLMTRAAEREVDLDASHSPSSVAHSPDARTRVPDGV